DIQRVTVVFKYFAHIKKNHKAEFVDTYVNGISMWSKSDIHLRLENSIFHQFFNSFREAIQYNEKCENLQDVKEAGFKHLNEFFPDKYEYDKIIDIGIDLASSNKLQIKLITQEEIFLMKRCCDLYFIKLSTQYLKSKK